MDADMKKKPLGWFRWVPFSILFLGALVPVLGFLYIHVNHPAKSMWWGSIYFSIFLLIVPIVCFAFPFNGGILGVGATIIMAFIAFFLLWDSDPYEEYLLSLGIFFLLFSSGSLISISYGIYNWSQRRKQGKQEIK
jgi:hypothetical protein